MAAGEVEARTAEARIGKKRGRNSGVYPWEAIGQEAQRRAHNVQTLEALEQLSKEDKEGFEETKAEALRKAKNDVEFMRRFYASGKRRAEQENADGDGRFKMVPQAQYDEVVARFTNSDGTKKDGWMKAPNGKPTNLDERQWVQVRTPALKERMGGDWEAQAEVAPSTITDAKTHIKTLMNAHAEVQTSDGATLRFSGQSKKAYSKEAELASASPAVHWSAVNHIEDLCRRAITLWREAPRNGSNDISAYVKYGAIFTFNGEQYLAKITTKEYPNKDKQTFYNVESIAVEKIAARGIHETITKGQSLDTSSNNKIANLIENAKVNPVSLALDENGEPEVDEDGGARFKLGPLYTGARVAYNKPDLAYVGTGEGAQVFGWGLYASDSYGVAKSYADRYIEHDFTLGTVRPTLLGTTNNATHGTDTLYDISSAVFDSHNVYDAVHDAVILALADRLENTFVPGLRYHKDSSIALQELVNNFYTKMYVSESTKISIREILKENIAELEREIKSLSVITKKETIKREKGILEATRGWLEWLDHNHFIQRGDDIILVIDPNSEYRIKVPPAENAIHEQTWFTNRADGDESHLLSWFGAVTDEQKKWVLDGLKQEFGISTPQLEEFKEVDSGYSLYHDLTMFLAYKTGIPFLNIKGDKNPEAMKAASLFLARHGFDGVKYPVDASNNAQNRDGRKGWNYVSFRDDNVRVDKAMRYNPATNKYDTEARFRFSSGNQPGGYAWANANQQGVYQGLNGTQMNMAQRWQDAALGAALYDKLINAHGPVFRAAKRALGGAAVADDVNLEIAVKNMPGRIRAAVEDASTAYVEPLMKFMQQHGLEMEKLDNYLYAAFAPERNAQIAARTATVDPITGGADV